MAMKADKNSHSYLWTSFWLDFFL